MLISTHLSGTPRPMKKFEYFLDRVQKQLDIVTRRYYDMSFHTGGPIAFLSDLLYQIDDPGVLKRDMLDVHINTILEELPSINRIFDAAESGVRAKTNMFIKGSTQEIFIPTTGVLGNRATVLDDWSTWKNIQPIKLVAHDSNELKLFWYHQITFDMDQPSYAVFAIDTEALLVKYLVYLREFDYPLDNNEIHNFINFEVIPFLYRDMVDIWVTKVLVTLSNEEEVLDLRSDDLHAESAYKSAIEEMSEFYRDLIRGKFRIADLLLTPFFLEERSLKDMVVDHEEIYSASTDRRHMGYGILKMANIINLMSNALDDTRDRGLETAAIRKLQYDARLVQRSNWSSHIRNELIVGEVDNVLTGIDELSL